MCIRDREEIDQVEANLSKMPPVSQMIERGLTPEKICFMALERCV